MYNEGRKEKMTLNRRPINSFYPLNFEKPGEPQFEMIKICLPCNFNVFLNDISCVQPSTTGIQECYLRNEQIMHLVYVLCKGQLQKQTINL